MGRKRNGYGLLGSYAAYGLTKDRAKELLRECRAGQHEELVREAAKQADPCIAKWIVQSIMEGKTFKAMAIRWELGEAEVMPCCRNGFYSYRKLTLVILNDMLAGKDK